MKNGLVVGKFAPYHKGHEALIKFAKERCDQLFVVVCEEPDMWESSLKGFSYLEEGIHIIVYPYNSSLAYVYEDTDEETSKNWAKALQKILPRIDIVFSSETYGINFAKHLNAWHIMYDLLRSDIHISGTDIRNNLIDKWNMLPNISKKFYQRIFVICGTESTGKTTLFNKCMEIFPQFSYIPEYGRERVLNSQKVTLEDLKDIIKVTKFKFEQAQEELKPIIVMDTDEITTLGYAHLNNLNLDIDHILKRSKVSYLFLNIDLDFVQDGTRLAYEDRGVLHFIHLNNHIRYSKDLEIINHKKALEKLFQKIKLQNT